MLELAHVYGQVLMHNVSRMFVRVVQHFGVHTIAFGHTIAL